MYVGSLWLYSHVVEGTALSEAQAVVSNSASQPFWLVAFFVGLVAYGINRLLAGPFPIDPFIALPGTALVALAVLLVVWAMRSGTRAARRLLGAALLLTAGCYGSVAAGRVYILGFGYERAISQLRYQYAGIATLALAVAAVSMALATALPRLAAWRASLLATLIAGWSIAFWFFPLPIDHHDEARADTMFAIAWMRSLADRVPVGEDVYIINRHFRALSPFMFPLRDFPGWAGLFSIFFPDPYIDGRRAVFVEPDATVRAAHRNARRLAGALMAPEDVPTLPELTPVDPVCPIPPTENALAQVH
jgi:hypothetical protein